MATLLQNAKERMDHLCKRREKDADAEFYLNNKVMSADINSAKIQGINVLQAKLEILPSVDKPYAMDLLVNAKGRSALKNLDEFLRIQPISQASSGFLNNWHIDGNQKTVDFELNVEVPLGVKAADKDEYRPEVQVSTKLEKFRLENHKLNLQFENVQADLDHTRTLGLNLVNASLLLGPRPN